MKVAFVAVGLWIFQIAATPTARPQATKPNVSIGQSFGPEITFDTKGVDFGPWIARFMSQIKRNWFIPCVALRETGHAVLTFNIRNDGSVTDVQVRTPASSAVFNQNAQIAILSSSPTLPLPEGYPLPQAFFTVTFYYGELPPGASPGQVAPNARRPEDSACFLVGLNASDVERRLGKPSQVDGLRWTYTTAAGLFAVYFDDTQTVIDVRPTGFDLTLFKK